MDSENCPTRFAPKHFTNKFTEHGKKYEKEALRIYSKNHNNCVISTPGFIISETFPWLAFSPDGIIFNNGVPSKLLEIKCPFSGKTNAAETFLESCDYIDKTGVT
ncbi:hypothetical protein NQ315_006590 [Exocentrus adspersus]|uniref:YqaJ viral recombinase domain-containing protein n=1 Tax=Exocentrus adspersus TaxID=1586481 RepID=A0AAV8VFV8_9CUCU|nr:hypothetical protein NQ315_006590 [Exocentrus adspersus]